MLWSRLPRLTRHATAPLNKDEQPRYLRERAFFPLPRPSASAQSLNLWQPAAELDDKGKPQPLSFHLFPQGVTGKIISYQLDLSLVFSMASTSANSSADAQSRDDHHSITDRHSTPDHHLTTDHHSPTDNHSVLDSFSAAGHQSPLEHDSPTEQEAPTEQQQGVSPPTTCSRDSRTGSSSALG